MKSSIRKLCMDCYTLILREEGGVNESTIDDLGDAYMTARQQCIVPLPRY